MNTIKEPNLKKTMSQDSTRMGDLLGTPGAKQV